jgi:hypothetical protein
MAVELDSDLLKTLFLLRILTLLMVYYAVRLSSLVLMQKSFSVVEFFHTGLVALMKSIALLITNSGEKLL